MKAIDKSKLRTGQVFLVDNEDNPSWFAKQIKRAQDLEYPKDVARFHHAGKIIYVADQFWIAEEGRISGVVITPLDEYLAKDKSVYMIREPKKMTKADEEKFIMCCVRDANKGHYKIGAIFNQLYHFVNYAITKKQKYINIGKQTDDFVCSTRCQAWDNEVLGLWGAPFNMAPADYVVCKEYKTIMTI